MVRAYPPASRPRAHVELALDGGRNSGGRAGIADGLKDRPPCPADPVEDRSRVSCIPPARAGVIEVGAGERGIDRGDCHAEASSGVSVGSRNPRRPPLMRPKTDFARRSGTAAEGRGRSDHPENPNHQHRDNHAVPVPQARDPGHPEQFSPAALLARVLEHGDPHLGRWVVPAIWWTLLPHGWSIAPSGRYPPPGQPVSDSSGS